MPDLARWIALDRQLQGEIDAALARLADCAPSAVDLRLSRVLAAVLEPAWKEHTSFQDEALFPLIARLGGTTAETRALLADLSAQHVEIGAWQREATVVLAEIVADSVGRRRAVCDRLGDCLARTVVLRRRHHDAESVLPGALPLRLDADDQAAVANWIASRPARPFPLNLLLALRH